MYKRIMKELILRYHTILTPEQEANARDFGLLIIRLGIGLMMAFSHGLGKVQKLMAGGPYQWADPLGIGAGLSLFLAGGAEFFCSLALAVGLFTRLASLPLAFTMVVAVGVVHWADPFKKKEFALLYLFAYLLIFLAGPGRYSIDAWMKDRFK